MGWGAGSWGAGYKGQLQREVYEMGLAPRSASNDTGGGDDSLLARLLEACGLADGVMLWRGSAQVGSAPSTHPVGSPYPCRKRGFKKDFKKYPIPSPSLWSFCF